MKQTAVEYLIKYLTLYGMQLNDNAIINVINVAKDIEKEQIVNAYKEGHYHLHLDSFNPEQYYNETFSETIVTEYRDGTIDVEHFKSE